MTTGEMEALRAAVDTAARGALEKRYGREWRKRIEQRYSAMTREHGPLLDAVTEAVAEALDLAAVSEAITSGPSYRAWAMYANGELGRASMERPQDAPRQRRVECTFCGAHRLIRNDRGGTAIGCSVCGCTAYESVR